MRHPSLLLSPLEYLYHTASAMKRAAYLNDLLPRVELPVPVVSVGNITAGGTGKTPVVAALASLLAPVFGRVGLLSRAYGTGFAWSLNLVSDGRRVLLDRRWSGDEPMVIRRSSGMTIAASGKNRARSGEYLARKLGAGVLVLDDGFQYWRMRRDFDLVLVDATNPFGGMAFLPVGRLREHPSSLSRADLVMVTRAGSPGALPFEAVSAAVRRFNGGCPIIPCSFVPEGISRISTGDPGGNGTPVPLETIRGRSIAAFCGIGNPDSFRETLESLGGRVKMFETFPDHHPYAPGEIDGLAGRAEALGLELFTTAKDLMNLPAMPGSSGGPFVHVLETVARFDRSAVLSTLASKGLLPRHPPSLPAQFCETKKEEACP